MRAKLLMDTVKILSHFRTNYQEAFTGGESQDILKSEGVDKARGLVFSLDTMQSYFITKKMRHLENIPINSFLISATNSTFHTS